MTLFHLMKDINIDLSLSQKEAIGQRILIEWLKTGEPKPNKVMVTEPHGEFLVNDYSPNFEDVMIRTIREYLEEITEKPINNQSGPDSISCLPSSKKLRKRIPIKPHFSGKQVFNKK